MDTMELAQNIPAVAFKDFYNWLKLMVSIDTTNTEVIYKITENMIRIELCWK